MYSKLFIIRVDPIMLKFPDLKGKHTVYCKCGARNFLSSKIKVNEWDVTSYDSNRMGFYRKVSKKCKCQNIMILDIEIDTINNKLAMVNFTLEESFMKPGGKKFEVELI